MFKQFITASLRYILRNRVITSINIVGLTFGITFSLLIGLYVKKELSVDRDFINGNNIYRIEFQYPDRGKRSVRTSALGPDLQSSIAGIEEVLRIQFREQIVLGNKSNNYFNINRICLADSTFFDFFDQTWIYGTPDGALNKPYSIVLTDELTKTIFGDINPLGLTLRSTSGRSVYTVTGVIEKRNDSHLDYDALLSLVTRGATSNTILHTYSTHQWLTYFLVENGTNIKELEEQIYDKLFDLFSDLRDGTGNTDFKVVLNPLKKIYFDRQSGDLGSIHGNYSLVMIFIAIAIVIILMACINFINLSTATAMRRAREVGMRKVVGSTRIILINHFLTESFTISFISTFLGLGIAELILPYFNNLVGSRFDITYFDNPYTIPVLLGIILLTGLLAGLYPAYYISSYKVIRVIRGEITKGRKSVMFRRGLILFQFFISVILIDGSLLVMRQMKYTHEKDLGFKKENILTLDIPGPVYNHMDIVRKELLKNHEIVDVSYSLNVPGSSNWNYEGFDINNQRISSMVLSIDPHYIKTYGIEIVAGRDFDETVSTDSVSSCLINETLAGQIGLENPVNESFRHENWYITMFPVENFRIIGVVKDFHFKSFRSRIEPLILAWNPEWHQYMNIKIAEGMIVPAMDKIMETLDEFAPGIPVDYSIVDESFDQMYRSDKRMSTILIYFTLLAVLIGVLGLIGMALFISEQRTREIAIYKTYGASVASVIAKLTKEFIILTVIANILGWPLVIWLGTKWLNEFAYKTSIGAGIFIIGALVSIVVVLITVISVTFRTAVSNPADSLRYE